MYLCAKRGISIIGDYYTAIPTPLLPYLSGRLRPCVRTKKRQPLAISASIPPPGHATLDFPALKADMR
jgi:hypothetical protein